MQTKKVLPLAAAAVMITHQAGCQPTGQQIPFDGDISKRSPNQTLYGPLRAIGIPGTSLSARFVPYPDIDPEIRKNITNGGLGIICSSCNTTGCICPETIDGFFDVCEGCRGTKDGGIKCYCSPSVSAVGCSKGWDSRIYCDGDWEHCKPEEKIDYCEPHPWYENPELANMTAAAVVYDFKTVTIEPGVDIKKLRQKDPGEHVFNTPLDPAYISVDAASVQGKASKNVIGAGAAAAVKAAGISFLVSL